MKMERTFRVMAERLPATAHQATRATSLHAAHILPALIASAGERASMRFLEFFAANIRNLHTRRAYGGAVAAFLAWCEDNQARTNETPFWYA
jgi:hypothetical protein